MNHSNTESRPVSVDCLSRDTLSDLVLGKLPAETIEKIGSHIETCKICQDILDTLDGLEDSVIKDLRNASHGQAEQISPELERQLQQAEAISHAVWQELETGGEPLEEDLPSRLGQYELLERLGQGGMGVVYKAIHTRLKRPVAVKVLRRERLRDPESIARFHWEMEAVGQLDHPHLVRAYDAGEAEGLHYLVMEFLDGVNLARLVRRTGPLSVADACEVVHQAAQGLQYAHEHGLVHRDVKPSNLMLNVAGQVKVLDLGLARLSTPPLQIDGMTGTDQVMGTGDFIAPEQGQDARQADARSDIYALGCTFYFLLAGRAPFECPERDTFVKKVLAHVHEPVPPLRQFRDNLPEAVNAVLMRMLAKEPGDRFPTAANVAEELIPWAVQANLGQLVTTTILHQDPVRDESLTDTPDSRHPILPTVMTPPWPLNRTRNPPWKRGLWGLLLTLGCLGVLAIGLISTTGSLAPYDEGTPRGRAARAGARQHKPTATPHGKQRGPALATPLALPMKSNPSATDQAKSLPERVVNSIGMKLHMIPAGEFVMGSPGSDVDALSDEKPQHRVMITKPFYLSQCEVTVGQFRQFVAATGFRTEAERDGAGGWQADQASSKGRHTQDTTWENPGYFQTDEHPVTVVTWNDAVAFCQWLSEKESEEYRLPTEAEWEYACRAGTPEIRHIGSEPLEHFDWNLLNAGLRTWPVGRKKANPWGLFDMYGNAREWCADRYAADYYQNSPLNDPPGPLAGDERVVRGSCFMDLPPFIRSAKRLKWPAGERINNQGFRIAKSTP